MCGSVPNGAKQAGGFNNFFFPSLKVSTSINKLFGSTSINKLFGNKSLVPVRIRSLTSPATKPAHVLIYLMITCDDKTDVERLVLIV